MGFASRRIADKTGNRILHGTGEKIRQNGSDTLVHMTGDAIGNDLAILLVVKHVHQTVDRQQVVFHDIADGSSQFLMAPRNEPVNRKGSYPEWSRDDAV